MMQKSRTPTLQHSNSSLPAPGSRLRALSPVCFNPSILVASALCLAGAFIGMLGFAAIGDGPYLRPGQTERVSVASDGTQGQSDQFGFLHAVRASISADGRFVAFQNSMPNLVSHENTTWGSEILVHDRVTGTTERVSMSSAGEEADNYSFDPAISADGRFVAFQSWATNLVPGDTNDATDIYVHDRATGTTERVSVSSSGGQGDDASFATTISADGRFVAFVSSATNLIPGDSNGKWDVFVRDRVNGTTERVSVASDGTEGNDDSGVTEVAPSISADGRFVAFRSVATNLVSNDVNGVADVFVHD